MADKIAFTKKDGQRIAAAVRRVESGDRKGAGLSFGFRPVVDSESTLRVGKYTGSSAWASGTCATITLWERAETGCSPAEKYPAESIENVANLSYDVMAGSWVVIGQAADGKWYLVEAGKTDSTTTCRRTIGGEDITTLPGWVETKVQLLGHDTSGCLKWFDILECDTGGTGGTGGGTE